MRKNKNKKTLCTSRRNIAQFSTKRSPGISAKATKNQSLAPGWKTTSATFSSRLASNTISSNSPYNSSRLLRKERMGVVVWWSQVSQIRPLLTVRTWCRKGEPSEQILWRDLARVGMLSADPVLEIVSRRRKACWSRKILSMCKRSSNSTRRPCLPNWDRNIPWDVQKSSKSNVGRNTRWSSSISSRQKWKFSIVQLLKFSQLPTFATLSSTSPSCCIWSHLRTVCWPQPDSPCTVRLRSTKSTKTTACRRWKTCLEWSVSDPWTWFSRKVCGKRSLKRSNRREETKRR